MTNYYVYYKVDALKVEGLRLSVQELLETVESQTGILGRLMHRRDQPLTYMEVYEGVQDEQAFEAVLARASAKLGLARKTERFVPA